MRRPCREVEPLIGLRAGALDDAARLVLEQHLSECESCRRSSALMRNMVELMGEPSATLGPSARERAIASAFTRAERRRSLPAAPVRRPALAFALVAAAAAAVIGLRPAEPPSTPTPAAHPPAVATVPAAEQREQEREPERRVPADEWFEAEAAEVHALAHAQATFSADSRARFHPHSRTLELERGRVQLDVDERERASFTVVTRQFRVEVLGTQFAVSPDRVEVQRGRVAVYDRSGEVLARELAAGATFTYTPPAAKAAAARTEDARSQRGGALLERARAAIARGEVASARELVARAERKPLSRAERAEAGTLRAECAILERDGARAIRAYLEVAEHFGELPAGENAAFAAAQLSARRNDGDTRALLERYLARYPNGRFAPEARARLARLP